MDFNAEVNTCKQNSFLMDQKWPLIEGAGGAVVGAALGALAGQLIIAEGGVAATAATAAFIAGLGFSAVPLAVTATVVGAVAGLVIGIAAGVLFAPTIELTYLSDDIEKELGRFKKDREEVSFYEHKGGNDDDINNKVEDSEGTYDQLVVQRFSDAVQIKLKKKGNDLVSCLAQDGQIEITDRTNSIDPEAKLIDSEAELIDILKRLK